MGRKYELSEKDLELLSSLSQALLHKTPKRSRVILYFWILTFIAIIIWASIAKVDEIVRTSGKIIPYGENKVLQNLEGGIVENILVNEGDHIKKGQVLLKIKNIKSKSELEVLKTKYYNLLAKANRLEAQSLLKDKIKFDKIFDTVYPEFKQREIELYKTNKLQLEAQINTFKKQIKQKKDQLKMAKTKIRNLSKSYSYVAQEIKMTEPMVKEGVKSKVDFLKLKREANNIKTEIDNIKENIPQIYSSIAEIQSKMKEAKLSFKSKAEKEFNDVSVEIEKIKHSINAYKDTVTRTFVKSPIDGIVKKLYVNTIGGVIKPGMNLVEIVPENKNLIAEVKVNPKDIAFIFPGQKALVKFTAYNYSIYGGLKGKVIEISPDTITDRKDKTFYIVRIRTDKNVLEHNGKKLKIIPGMTVNADIITGKRTIMDYILKPILNSKEYIFTDR